MSTNLKENVLSAIVFIIFLVFFMFVFKACDQSDDKPDHSVNANHDHNANPPNTEAPLVSTTIPSEVDAAQRDLLGFQELYCLVRESDIPVDFNGEEISKEEAFELLSDAADKYNSLDKPDYANPNFMPTEDMACQEL